MSTPPAGAPQRPAWDVGRRSTSSRVRHEEGGAPSRLGAGIGVSVVLHVVAIAVLVTNRPAPRPAQPPVYRVDLVAAPPGPRSIGTVTPEPPAPTPPAVTPPTPTPRTPTPPAAKPPAAPPPRAATPPTKATLPTKTAAKPTPKKSTPVPPTPAKATPAPPTKTAEKPTTTPKTATPTPRAGGGPEGGRGADVANVNVKNGLQFPFPGYLENIVRVVAVRFTPPRGSTLTADVSFLIHRDGSVSDVRFVKRSGNYGFDVEAQGAIESAGSSRAFGPLPGEFKNDVLPVTFSFDPRVIR